MYTSQHDAEPPKRRAFKFQKKAENKKPQLAIAAGIEWPPELLPLEDLQQTKVKKFYSVVDKVKAYVLAENFKHVLREYKSNQDESNQDEFYFKLKKYNQEHLFSFYRCQILNLISNQNRIQSCWQALKNKVTDQLAVFDSNHFCDNLLPDRIIAKSVKVNFENQNFLQQFENAVMAAIKICQQIFKTEKIGQCQIFATFILKGYYKQRKVKHSTNSIELKHLVDSLALYINGKAEVESLLSTVGLDSKLRSLELQNLSNVSFHKVKVNVYRTLHKSLYLAGRKEMELQEQIGYQNPVPNNIAYDASLIIYAISRARVQYLSSCIPLFRFKHCLFEALIAAVHERDLRPYSQQDDENNQIQDPIKHERFLLKKFLEFMAHPVLQNLLKLSSSGSTFAFVNFFNQIKDSECPAYSKFKISLYDINQRKFVIENHNAKKEVYMVHYNGTVFGANYARMIIIREREVEPQSQDTQKVEASDGLSQISESIAKYKLQEIIKNESSEEEQQDENVLDIKKVFILSSQHLSERQRRKQYRRQKDLEQFSNDSSRNLVGMIAVKMEFDDDDQPQRLVSYGSLPLKNQQMLKIFEGPKCHVKFLLWALQNVIDYKLDWRNDHTAFQIVTIGGCEKEYPFLLRALVQLSGRDTHFFGDLNKVRCITHENIKFFDLQNYFECSTLEQLAMDWLRQTVDERCKDVFVDKVILTHRIAAKFFKELQQIYFNSNQKRFDFMTHQKETACGLALSIFQYLYLEPQQEIKGTLDRDILLKEKSSVKSCFVRLLKTFEAKSQTVRVYKLNKLMTRQHMEQPIPFVMKGFQTIDLEIDSAATIAEYKPCQTLFVKLQNGQEVQLLYTSLYKVESLTYKSNYLFWQVQNQDCESSNQSITQKYIWGIELINGLRTGSIEKLKISEEITYYQSRLFSKFVQDILIKIKGCQDRCQLDILEMILDNFAVKFNQKTYNLQQIIHINDLKLIQQPRKMQWQGEQARRKKVAKIFEVQHPFYYAEFDPDISDAAQQVGSLARITGFLNSAYRVALSNSIQQLECSNKVMYMDHQYLVLQNEHLHNSFNQNSKKYDQNEIGRWQLVLEGKYEDEKIQQFLQNIQKKLINQQKVVQLGEFNRKFKIFSEKVDCSDKFLKWMLNQHLLVTNPKLFRQIIGVDVDSEWLKILSEDQNVIQIDEQEEQVEISLNDIVDEPLWFSKQNQINAAADALQIAVTAFETQFASGQLEAVVLASEKRKVGESGLDQPLSKTANSAYPLGHPMNPYFDVNQQQIVQCRTNLNECLSPTGLSSQSSSFANNQIAQRYNLIPDDPILSNYIGDINKGAMVEDFFTQQPLHQQKRQRH